MQGERPRVRAGYLRLSQQLRGSARGQPATQPAACPPRAPLAGNVLRHLNKLQMDQEPSIRANTTVLLGNIADLLGDVYCKKVGVEGFHARSRLMPARQPGGPSNALRWCQQHAVKFFASTPRRPDLRDLI